MKYLDSLVSPYQAQLMDLFWRYVHPTVPILEPRSTFTQALARNSIPATLLGAMYGVALSFLGDDELCPGHERPDPYPFHGYLISALNLEGQTPNIRTLQAHLIYMQMPPVIHREPNLPAAWSRSAWV